MIQGIELSGRSTEPCLRSKSEHCSLKGFGVFDLIGGNDSGGIELSGRSTEPCLRSKSEHCSLKGFGVFDLIGGKESGD